MDVSSSLLTSFVYHGEDFSSFTCFYSLLINTSIVFDQKKKQRKKNLDLATWVQSCESFLIYLHIEHIVVNPWQSMSLLITLTPFF